MITKNNSQEETQKRISRFFQVGDIIRMPHYKTVGKYRWRVWKITAQYIGGLHQEGTYSMIPLDILENEPINIPCLILETHPEIEKV